MITVALGPDRVGRRLPVDQPDQRGQRHLDLHAGRPRSGCRWPPRAASTGRRSSSSSSPSPRWPSSSPRRSGPAVRGTRDQPRRMNALGYHVWLIRFLAFLLSGFWTGVAGVLYLYYNQFVSPQAVALAASAEALLMVIAGGTATLLGPIIGAGPGRDHEERRERLHRALELRPRRHLRRHRRLHAGGAGAGDRAIGPVDGLGVARDAGAAAGSGLQLHTRRADSRQFSDGIRAQSRWRIVPGLCPSASSGAPAPLARAPAGRPAGPRAAHPRLLVILFVVA